MLEVSIVPDGDAMLMCDPLEMEQILISASIGLTSLIGDNQCSLDGVAVTDDLALRAGLSTLRDAIERERKKIKKANGDG